MPGWIQFVRQSLSHPQQVGAICASSRSMGWTMTDAIGIGDAKNIVELGPGDGAFTEVILERMSRDQPGVQRPPSRPISADRG